MKARNAAIPMIALLALAGAASAQSEMPTDTQTDAQSDQTKTLLIDRVQRENQAAEPTRGQTMAEVEARFGAPADKLEPRGGQKQQWPTINRWSYPNFTVYFEKNRVIDVVVNKASANEVGPKPPIK